MKIDIRDKNNIKSANIGTNNKITKEEGKANKVFIEIIVGIFITVVGGIVLYFITK